jgi:1,4-dihydroxy-6-naphthoate synthase
LGKWWRDKTGLPLQLGGNAIRRSLGPETITQVAKALKDSIQYGLDHREEALEYAMQFARDLDRSLANRFVSMYVNERTVDYGEEGRQAIRLLLEEGHKAKIIPTKAKVEFVE